MVKLSVRMRDINDTEALREQVERRLSFATDRFSAKIVDLSIVVSDVNGPRGGVDKRCTIRGVLEGGKSISIEERRADASAAVTCAVRRLNASITRMVLRARQGRTSAMRPAKFEADAA